VLPHLRESFNKNLGSAGDATENRHKMVKRKRDEPKLGESLEKWEKSLMRGLKAAKGFERQRLSKRIRDADPEKVARLEKEIAVLKVKLLLPFAHRREASIDTI
jgi:hypothetical protein